MSIRLGKIAYRVARFLGCPTSQCCRAYFFFDRSGRRDVIEKAKRPETWRQFYTRLYGFEPDWIKHSPSVHWDEPHNPPDVAEVIRAEEERYRKLRDRNEKLIKAQYHDPAQLTGKTLAMLHHTHGCDPTMVEDILGIGLPEPLHDEYMIVYSRHRETGGTIH